MPTAPGNWPPQMPVQRAMRAGRSDHRVRAPAVRECASSILDFPVRCACLDQSLHTDDFGLRIASEPAAEEGAEAAARDWTETEALAMLEAGALRPGTADERPLKAAKRPG